MALEAKDHPEFMSRLFGHDLPVCSARWNGPNLPPTFGEDAEWDLSGMGQPANRFGDWGRVNFSGLSPAFNLLARELAFCMLNPVHAALRKHNVFLQNKPSSPSTVTRIIPHIRLLQFFQEHEGLPTQLGEWSIHDLRNATRVQDEAGVSEKSIAEFALWLGTIRRFGPALTGGLPSGLVWTKNQAREWARKVAEPSPVGTLKTEPIPPAIFYPLMGAAIAYVERFSVDILKARAWTRKLTTTNPRRIKDIEAAIQLRLSDPNFKIPLHSGSHGRGKPNYRLLSLLVSEGASAHWFNSAREDIRDRRQTWVAACLQDGRGKIGAFPASTCGLGGRDGSAWHEDFDEQSLQSEVGALRTACYIVVAATTLMRDSEIQEIRVGSLVEHYGAPAIRSVQIKHRPDRPELYWWLHPVGATAISVAESLTDHPTHIFAPLKQKESTEGETSNVGFHAAPFIRKFVSHVNKNLDTTGLDAIPTYGSATPRQFRRTMAIQVGQQPGGELALGVILKHVSGRAIANASTYGYAAPTSEWMEDYEDTRLRTYLAEVVDSWETDFDAHRAVSAPGEVSYNQIFDQLLAARSRPQEGDRAQLIALLRTNMPGLRIGTFNHCMGDISKARCVGSNTSSKIDPFRCDPGRCGNSVVTSEHLPLLRSELSDVETMLKTPKISSSSRSMLQARKVELTAMLPGDAT